MDIKNNSSNSLRIEKQFKNIEDIDSNQYSNQENNNQNQKNEKDLENLNNNNYNNNNYLNKNNYNNKNNSNNNLNNEIDNRNKIPYIENIQNLPINNNIRTPEQNINNMNFQEDNNIDYRLQYALNKLGLNSLINVFLNNNMSFNDLLFLTKDDLNELNLELVQRNRLLIFIKEFSSVAKYYSLDEIKAFFGQNPKFKN